MDEELLCRFAAILSTLASGYDIDEDEFEKYSLKTARRYLDLYEWKPMTVAVYKVLIHGADVIRLAQFLLVDKTVFSRL